MAAPKNLKWNKLLIQIGNGATPEVFAEPCMISTKSATYTNNTTEWQEPADCDDPDSIWATTRETTSQDTNVSGEGRLAMQSFDTYREWADAGDVRNVRIRYDAPAADSGGHYTVPMILQTFTTNGNREDGTVAVSIELVAAGPRVWTDAT